MTENERADAAADGAADAGAEEGGLAWLVETDRDACIGSGICVSVMPARFTLTDGRSTVVDPYAAPGEELVELVDLCPMGAIRVLERASGRVVAPADDDV